MTVALEGDEWSAARLGRTLPPKKIRYPFYRRLGGPQGRSERVENLVPTGIRSRTVQTVVSRYTDLVTRPTQTLLSSGFILGNSRIRIQKLAIGLKILYDIHEHFPYHVIELSQKCHTCPLPRLPFLIQNCQKLYCS